MPYNRLSTAKIAKELGVHPNTVRLYEQTGFIAPVPRSPKGYRLYTVEHQEQMRLARLGMEGQFAGPIIRRSVIEVVRCTATGDYPAALAMAREHRKIVRGERAQADAAADFLQRWAQGLQVEESGPPLHIAQVARLLNLSADVLRNWERSGLLTVPRDPLNRYRQYTAAEIGRLRVIRFLRQAGYSPMAILRMLVQLDQGQARADDLRRALDTPREDEDVYTASDRWLTALDYQEEKAARMIELLEQMVVRFPAVN